MQAVFLRVTGPGEKEVIERSSMIPVNREAWGAHAPATVVFFAAPLTRDVRLQSALAQPIRWRILDRLSC